MLCSLEARPQPRRHRPPTPAGSVRGDTPAEERGNPRHAREQSEEESPAPKMTEGRKIVSSSPTSRSGLHLPPSTAGSRRGIGVGLECGDMHHPAHAGRTRRRRDPARKLDVCAGKAAAVGRAFPAWDADQVDYGILAGDEAVEHRRVRQSASTMRAVGSTARMPGGGLAPRRQVRQHSANSGRRTSSRTTAEPTNPEPPMTSSFFTAAVRPALALAAGTDDAEQAPERLRLALEQGLVIQRVAHHLLDVVARLVEGMVSADGPQRRSARQRSGVARGPAL